MLIGPEYSTDGFLLQYHLYICSLFHLFLEHPSRFSQKIITNFNGGIFDIPYYSHNSLSSNIFHK